MGAVASTYIEHRIRLIAFLPPDSDGIMGIIETPDQLCRTIAHTGAESRRITYKIDKDGKFIELSRQ
jgi:hypothetical protein